MQIAFTEMLAAAGMSGSVAPSTTPQPSRWSARSPQVLI